MDYQDLADNSKVWVYQSNRKLTENEVTAIQKLGDKFVGEWAAHGAELMADFKIFHNQFIVLFADENEVAASGCSIDTSVRFIQTIAQGFQIDLFDRMKVAYQTDSGVEILNMPDFQAAIANGSLSENTLVFNNTVDTKAAFVNNWKIPVKESWHAKMLA